VDIQKSSWSEGMKENGGIAWGLKARPESKRTDKEKGTTVRRGGGNEKEGWIRSIQKIERGGGERGQGR